MRSSTVSPLLEIPSAVAEELGVRELSVRAFGTEIVDLMVDFAVGRDGDLVTELLRSCTVSGAARAEDSLDLRKLPVGTRLRALVVLCLLAGKERLAWTVTCPSEGCGQMVDIELPLADLAGSMPALGTGWVEVDFENHRLQARLPTHEDVVRWRQAGTGAEEMVADLVSDELQIGVSPQLIAAVEAALIDADPLVAARVDSRCPACGSEIRLEVDVEAETLAILSRIQRELLDEICTLASAFHWSEQEIFEMPRERRHRYIAHLERGRSA